MISKTVTEALNRQLNWEFYSAYLYLSMAAYSTSVGLAGFANWFYVQVKEELVHAEKFYGYLNQQGGRVVLKDIEGPPKDFASAADLFKKTLEHEKKVTERIGELVNLARKEKDHATQTFLEWFVTEQVEEEASATEILQKLNIVGKDGSGLITIDSQLATRVFVPPQANL